MSYHPDGLSDEDYDDDDDFGIFDGSTDWNDGPKEMANTPQVRLLSEKEKWQQKVDNFYSAILNENVDEVKNFLTSDFTVKFEFPDEWTPLLLASSVGCPELVKLFLDEGADVHTHKDHYTSLMAACKCPVTTSPFSKSAEIIRMLIDSGIDVNAKTRKRMTALMYAANTGNELAVQILLSICDIHAIDNQGWHALFWAINANQFEVAKILVESGLDIDRIDIRKQSLYEFAQTVGYEEIMTLFPTKTNYKTDLQKVQTHYNFSTEFSVINNTTNKPNFFRDIYLMLHGMKAEMYYSLFVENNIDLYSFLWIDDEKLKQIGVIAPFHRYRILMGIHRFHKYPYKQKSMPVVDKKQIYTTMDLSKAIFTCIRQLVAMEASLEYVISQGKNIDKSKEIQSYIKTLKGRLPKFKQISNALHLQALQWDLYNSPADLITKDSAKKIRKRNSWFRIILPIVVISFGTIYYVKKRV